MFLEKLTIGLGAGIAKGAVRLWLKDLSPLAGLTGLQSLDLRGCHRIKDLAPIKKLPKLEIYR